jgi:hypothetical protein
MLQTLMALAALAAGTTAQAGSAPGPCPDHKFDRQGKTMVSWISGKNGCKLTVGPADIPVDTTPYRIYGFSDSGAFFVQVLRGRRDGARFFYLFPKRQAAPSYVVQTDGLIAVKTTAGEIVRFSPGTGRIVGMTGAAVTDSPAVNLSNKGGVEIRYQNGILLDSGWGEGAPASNDQDGSSVFHDPLGNTCTVKNTEFFTDFATNADPRPNVRPKFKTNEGIRQFLETRCPQLDVRSLHAVDPGRETQTPQAGTASGRRAQPAR